MQLSIQLKSRPTTRKVVDETMLWDNLNQRIEEFPQPDQEVVPGIRWGCYSQLYTPAYWKVQYLMHNYDGHFAINYRLGENILEEVVACLLGGFGLKSEIGLTAFNRLKKRKLIQVNVSHSSILSALREPFTLNGKQIRYRFPNQKSKFIAQFLNRHDIKSIPLNNDLELRNWLLSINGIGPKTASWITRNFLSSEKVAIIDIHIFRALHVMGLYSEKFDIQRDYIKLEEIFLDFCRAIDVQPSKMDALMWLQMKESNRLALKALVNS